MDLNSLYGQLLGQAGSNTAQRDQLIMGLLNGSNGGPGASTTISGLEGLFNTSDPLQPAALASLRQEAQSGLPQRYNQAFGNIMTSLQQRGMAGSGDRPANEGQIAGGLAPLQSELANAQSQAGAQTELANQQQILQSLLANRGLAAQGVGMANSLIGNIGNIYNPQPYFTNALNTAGTQIGAYGAQTGAFSPAIQAATGLGNLQPTSFKNILIASLLGAGGKALSDPNTLRSIISAIGGIFGGGGRVLGGGNGTDTPSVGNQVPLGPWDPSQSNDPWGPILDLLGGGGTDPFGGLNGGSAPVPAPGQINFPL
jgi:hypothetical protein